MKHRGALTFAFIIILLATSTKGLNSTYGAVGVYDRLLYREYVIVKPLFFRIVSKDVEYPPKGYQMQRTITAVRAIDQTRGKNGGYATLYRGGPGFRNASLHLTSVRSQGLNFIVEIYGH